jgi:cytochrome P450
VVLRHKLQASSAGTKWSDFVLQTVSAVHTFFFVMILHPEIQRLAQAEVDAVIGSDRLPKVSDRCSLPYIDSLIKEVLRWGTVSPMALPHSTAADDQYMGYKILHFAPLVMLNFERPSRYHIPKGCVVIPNIWAMLHDDSIYPESLKFNPTRFIGKQPQPDPKELAFGRGRRVCPGQHIAEASIFIQVASVLATFDIRRDVDEKGQEIEPEVGFTSAIVR